MPTTPTAMTPTVLAFCQQVSQHDPLYVPVKPMNGAKQGDCYNNARRKIQTDGGTIMYGWCIWEEPTFFIEAEHHAIWVSPEGEKADLTPHDMGEKRVLFLPDPEKVWNRIPILNHRHALTSDPRMKEFLALADELDALRLKNLQPDGRIMVPLQEQVQIEFRQVALKMQMGMPLPQAEQQMFGNMTPRQLEELRRQLMRGL